MRISPDNQPLGIVEEAKRRREQYARYIEKRVVVLLEDPATQRQIQHLVDQRVEAEVARLIAEWARHRLEKIERVVMPEGPLLGDIMAAVANAAHVTVGELVGPRRARALAWPRQVAVLVSELRPDLDTTANGLAFGGRDHTTVLHARKAARARIANANSNCPRICRQVRALLAPEDR